MKINDTRGGIPFCAAFARLVRASVFGLVIASAVHGEFAVAQYTDKITTTPIFIQDGFGPAGDLLPNNGFAFCWPCTIGMELSYLGGNGFSQVAPGNPNSAQALNLVEILGGLMGTDPLGGTTSAGITNGLEEYLAAKGISPANYTLNAIQSPTMSDIASINQPGAASALGIGFYLSDGTPAGGHGVTLLSQGINAQGQSSPNTVVINNPEPTALTPYPDTPANGLEYLNTIPTSGALAQFGSLEMDPNQYPAYYANTSLSVIQAVSSIAINSSQMASNDPTPATWTITGQESVGLNGGDLSVLAPIAGTGGLLKGLRGVLELEAPDISTGTNFLISGVLRSDVSAGLPFGTGTISIHEGTLEFAPASSSANVNLVAASSSGSQLQFVFGGTIALDLGSNDSLSITLGGNTNGTTANMARQSNGTLVIAASGGTADLGVNEHVIVNGAGSNLPALVNGIVNPYVVAQDNDAAASGDFLTYGANGYAKAAYTQASGVPITSAVTSSIFEANISQTIPASTTAQVFALKVDGTSISGGTSSVLKVGNQTGHTGLILNGGSISTTDLAFGSAEALIYTNNSGGTISSVIQGSGGVTTFGPGTLTLTGANTYSGGTNINSGILNAANSSGSATGTGAVTVEENGTLEVSGPSGVAGSASGTTIKGAATLLLNGGTVAGPLTIANTGYVLGSGKFSGAVTIDGEIGGSSVDIEGPSYLGVENITFSGSSVNFNNPSIYSWRLNSLTDDSSKAGIDWSLLQFTGPAGSVNFGNDGSPFAFTLDFGASLADPNSGDPFWDEPHQWLIATASNPYNNLWLTDGPMVFEQGSFGLSVDPQFENVYVNYAPVPEPTASMLWPAAAIGAALIRRRKPEELAIP